MRPVPTTPTIMELVALRSSGSGLPHVYVPASDRRVLEMVSVVLLRWSEEYSAEIRGADGQTATPES